MEVVHAILRKIWVVKQYLKFKENLTAWVWSEKIEKLMKKFQNRNAIFS